jgi:hypothetical protein
MAASPDAPLDDHSSPELAALHREVSALMHRWQQVGVSLHEVAMALATVGCQALGQALGDVPPPDGPEIIQRITHDLQRQAESCYFQHWRDDIPAF